MTSTGARQINHPTRRTSPAPTGDDAAGPAGLQARMPADVDAPDRILGDLTARQVATLAVALSAAYLVWRGLAAIVPTVVLIGLAVPAGGAVLALVAGRRDGLGLDVWLAHAAKFGRAPRRLLPARVPPPPDWAPAAATPARVGVLRLPVGAIDGDGRIRPTPATAVTLVAAGTVNVTHRQAGDQAGLVSGFTRWVNALTGPTQIVIAARGVDLAARAVQVAERAHLHVDPALTQAAIDYADFLLDLTEQTQPLARTLTIAATRTGPDAPTAATSAADQTVDALEAVGAVASVLDGPATAALLTTSTDPYQPGDQSWPRAVPGHAVRGHQAPHGGVVPHESGARVSSGPTDEIEDLP